MASHTPSFRGSGLRWTLQCRRTSGRYQPVVSALASAWPTAWPLWWTLGLSCRRMQTSNTCRQTQEYASNRHVPLPELRTSRPKGCCCSCCCSAKIVLAMVSFRPFSRIRRPRGRRRTAAAAWKGSGWYRSAVVRVLKLDGFGPNLIKNGFHVQGRRHPFRPIAVGSIDDDSGVGAVDVPGS